MIHLTPDRTFVYYSGNYDAFVKTKVRRYPLSIVI